MRPVFSDTRRRHIERDFNFQVSANGVAGHSRLLVSGENLAIDTASAPEDMWVGGGLYPFGGGTTTLEVFSASASDTSGGTGARTVLLSGVGNNFDLITEVVTLLGTTAVTTTNAFREINNCQVVSAGSGRWNAGDITIRRSVAGATIDIIPAGGAISRKLVYTVPTGYQLQIYNLTLSIKNAGGIVRTADFATFIRFNNGVDFLLRTVSVGSDTPFAEAGFPIGTIPEKTSITVRCTAVSNNGTAIAGYIIGNLIQTAFL